MNRNKRKKKSNSLVKSLKMIYKDLLFCLIFFRHKAKDVSLPLHHYKASLSLFASMCVFLGRADCDNEEGEESGFCELDL